ncbi:hypothetical protein Tco_1248084, partial [Tanacetum coccineum]
MRQVGVWAILLGRAWLLPVSEEPDVGRTQEPILADVSTQEPIVTEISTQVPIVEEVGTQKFSVEYVVLEDYVSSGEDAL